MMPAAILVLCVASLSAIMFTLLSLGYATVFILTLNFIGVTSLSEYVSIVLLSQIPVSILAARLRRRIVESKRHGTLNALILGVAAISGFTAALSLGIRLGDEARVIALSATSLLAALAMSNRASRTSDTRSSSILTGIVGGIVKGVLGGGVTPVILALQRFAGLSLDDSMYRTFIALALMSIASSIPYMLSYSLDYVVLVSAIIGGLIGVVVGEKIVLVLTSRRREKLSMTAYIILALLGILSFIVKLYS